MQARIENRIMYKDFTSIIVRCGVYHDDARAHQCIVPGIVTQLSEDDGERQRTVSSVYTSNETIPDV